MEKIAALTRSEIREYKGEHLYVMNISDHSNTRPRQELLMTYTINGTDVVINVPSTWIPLDLTARVTINQIKENRDFWLFISRRDLAVISREVAEEYLDQEDAQDEYDRIYGIERDTSHTITLNKSENRRFKKEKAPVGGVKVISIMSKDISETMKLAALKNIKHELSEEDFKYILNEAKVGEQEKLKSWASAELKR